MSVITHLFIKRSKGESMFACKTLCLLKDYGIESDKNANAFSPRQILVTRKEDLDEFGIQYGGLRENIIVEGLGDDAFIPGALLMINGAKIRLTFYCEPCKRIASAVPNLKVVYKRRGILGTIIEGGIILVGDKIQSIPNYYKPFSEVPYQRFLHFLQLIPKGKVATYKLICMGIGVDASYIRAFPQYIKKAVLNRPGLPLHRIVDSSGTLIEQYIPNQITLLKDENIKIDSEMDVGKQKQIHKIALDKYLWV